ncbi:MAG: chitobiase/beta-hexosaminidase C-terminal domain-containing protein [Opitutales bacterium]|nr:chitobiase/beta-hexosaminidase C-terminal domain-containing protein [Opitutales bacterium]
MDDAEAKALNRLQDDLEEILKASKVINQAAVLNERKGVTESDIEVSLSTLNEVNEKVGAVAVVRMPTIRTNRENAPGPSSEVIATIRMIVTPLFNESDDGTQIRIEEYTLRILNALHLLRIGRMTLHATNDTATPINDMLPEGSVGYDIALRARLALPKANRPAEVQITVENGEVSMNVATPGAIIRYTTDGSYPGINSEEYTAPFQAPAAPTTIRAVAWKENLEPGQESTTQITS